MSSRFLTSRWVLKANFWISSLRRSCLVGVDVSCSGFMEIPGSPSHGQFHGRFTTLGYLCVSHRCCLTHQLGKSDLCQSGLVQVFGDRLHECQEKLLEQSYTHLGSVWPWSMLSRRKSLHIVHSIECLHVMRLEGRISTNLLRIHMEGVHPLMKLWSDFWWRGTLTWIRCQMWCSTIQNNQKSKGFVSNLCRSMVRKDEVSKLFCPKSAHARSFSSRFYWIAEWACLHHVLVEVMKFPKDIQISRPLLELRGRHVVVLQVKSLKSRSSRSLRRARTWDRGVVCGSSNICALWNQYIRFTYRAEHWLGRDCVIMSDVARASIANGLFEVNAHALHELSNVTWEVRNERNDMAKHMLPKWAWRAVGRGEGGPTATNTSRLKENSVGAIAMSVGVLSSSGCVLLFYDRSARRWPCERLEQDYGCSALCNVLRTVERVCYRCYTRARTCLSQQRLLVSSFCVVFGLLDVHVVHCFSTFCVPGDQCAFSLHPSDAVRCRWFFCYEIVFRTLLCVFMFSCWRSIRWCSMKVRRVGTRVCFCNRFVIASRLRIVLRIVAWVRCSLYTLARRCSGE